MHSFFPGTPCTSPACRSVKTLGRLLHVFFSCSVAQKFTPPHSTNYTVYVEPCNSFFFLCVCVLRRANPTTNGGMQNGKLGRNTHTSRARFSRVSHQFVMPVRRLSAEFLRRSSGGGLYQELSCWLGEGQRAATTHSLCLSLLPIPHFLHPLNRFSPPLPPPKKGAQLSFFFLHLKPLFFAAAKRKRGRERNI